MALSIRCMTFAETAYSQNAQPGDSVFFTFRQKNHTITQSSFDSPCQRTVDGFDSGLSVPLCDVESPLTDKACSVPVPAENVAGPFPGARFFIRDTQPIWVYCRQANHCQQGMVFAVNPGDQFPAFKAKALASGNPSVSTSTPPAVSSSPPPPLPTSTSTPVVVNPPPTSTPTTGSDHRVVVGGTGLLFNPTTVVAQAGDTITFEFRQKNHTATQSTFSDPCKPLISGFNSG